jgi:hypothetical protein
LKPETSDKHSLAQRESERERARVSKSENKSDIRARSK